MNSVAPSVASTPSKGLGSTALLHLMHLVSPALPVGAYAYSQGLEFAIEGGWLNTPAQVEQWIEGLMTHALTTLDLPILARCIDAWVNADIQQVEVWDAWIRANRETKELLLEDEQLGMALNRLLVQLGLPYAKNYEGRPTAFVAQFSMACSHWQVPKHEALYGFAYSWLENQIAAATKLVPLGQTAAQKMLLTILPRIPSACECAKTLTDEQLGVSFPGLALASSLHERQYSRLFRS